MRAFDLSNGDTSPVMCTTTIVLDFGRLLLFGRRSELELSQKRVFTLNRSVGGRLRLRSERLNDCLKLWT